MTTQPQLYRLVRTATVIGPRAAIEGEPRREVGWLIEREDDHRWAIVLSDKLISWTSDSLKALRFARKEEAELFVELAQFSGPIKATEHIWMEPMRTVTDFHSVNLSTGEKTRSIVGDGQRVDEIVGPLLPKGPCSCQWEYSEIVYRDPNCPHLRRERIRKGLKLSTEEGSVQVAAIEGDCADCGHENGVFSPCPKHMKDDTLQQLRDAVNFKAARAEAPLAGAGLRALVTKWREKAKQSKVDGRWAGAIEGEICADELEAALAEPTPESNIPADVCPECTLGPPNWAERKEGYCVACNDTGHRAPTRTAKRVVDKWPPRFMGERK